MTALLIFPRGKIRIAGIIKDISHHAVTISHHAAIISHSAIISPSHLRDI